MGAIGGLSAGLGWLLLTLAVVGCAYMAAAAVMVRGFGHGSLAKPATGGVTVLKPLHGTEPQLAGNLATFLTQAHDGPVQLLGGIQRSEDPAIDVVDGLAVRFPQFRIDRIVDRTRHGANDKIGNLINMLPHAAHDVLILSDSDIAVPPGYLAKVLAALNVPGTGAVSCLYRGRGDAGFWSRLGAAGLSYQFLPGAMFGAATGLARPCMGSTIALRRATLEAIGGFSLFADTLADDHAIGAAIEALGLRIAVAPVLVVHASAERSLAELWRHEVRWGATVRDLVPAAYAASLIALPLPLAVLAAALVPLHGVAAAVVALALAARWNVAAAVDRLAGGRTAPYWLLPLRDCLSLAVFVASFGVRSVDWRGQRLVMQSKGRIAAELEFSA